MLSALMWICTWQTENTQKYVNTSRRADYNFTIVYFQWQNWICEIKQQTRDAWQKRVSWWLEETFEYANFHIIFLELFEILFETFSGFVFTLEPEVSVTHGIVLPKYVASFISIN